VLGVAGVALVTLVGAAWVFRLPLTDAAVRDALKRAGLDADFEISRVDLGGAAVRSVRIGPENAPDAVAALADVRIGWSLTGPRISGVRLVDPALRVRVDENGVSFGDLDRLRTGADANAPPSRLPPMRLDIENGRILFLTSAGAVPATFSAHGRLTRDFAGTAEIPTTSLTAADGRIDKLRLAIKARTDNGVLRVDADGAVDAVLVQGVAGAGLRLSGEAAIPRDLAAASAKALATGRKLSMGGMALNDARLDMTVAPTTEDRWAARIALRAETLTSHSASMSRPDISLTGVGDVRQAFGEWTVRSIDNRLGDLGAAEASASGAYTFDGRAADGPVIAASGQMTLPAASIGPEGRAKILRALPDMRGSPIGPLMGSGKSALEKVLTRFSTAAALKLDWRGGAGRFVLPGPLAAESASGARLTVTPIEPGRPVLMALLPSGALESGGRFDIEGGGLPTTTISLSRFAMGAGKLEADGAAAITDWRAAGGRLDLSRTTFSLKRDGERGGFSINGAMALDGRTEAIGVTDFRAPLRLDATWGGGFRVTLPDRCLEASAGGISIPGHRLNGRGISLCTGPDGVLVGVDAQGRMIGGFAANGVRFAGRTDDKAARPVAIAASRIEGRFVGAGADGHLELAATAPSYAIDYAADRRISFTGALMSARTQPGGRLSGAFRGGALDDPALPAIVNEFDARWSAGPERGRTVMRLRDGAARVTDKPVVAVVAEGSVEGDPPEEAEWRARYNPLRVTGIEGALIDGDIQAQGAIVLENGARALANFTAVHDLSTGHGEARVTNAGLQFSKSLDLYEITELARGVVDGVEGPVGVDLTATWAGDGLTTRGTLSPRNVDLNAVSLGPVEGISGDIAFDDLALFTTPPGQTLSIKRLNPGVQVDDGVITFQMLSFERIRIEAAKWPFSAGELAIDPQIVVLGGDEFRMNLTLREVDVQQLLQQLDFKDLTATGTVEGSFPLVFDSNGGRIVHGELRASPEGGTIKYTGAAGAGLIGAPQIAFDALKSFAYTDLVLELDGDLDGDIVSAIRFSGENVEPIGGIIAPGTIPVPGIQRLTVTGWPFKFNVSVRAPFRRLVKTSDGIQDGRPIVDEAIRNLPDDQPVVDPPKVDQPIQTPR